MAQNVDQIVALLRTCDEKQLAVMERSLAADTRIGVKRALEVARRRIAAEKKESERIDALYSYQARVAREHNAQVLVGLDEVGRGCIAGPLAVGAVVLPDDPHIEGLNDSKQVSPEQREVIARKIEATALACEVVFIDAQQIDSHGIMSCLALAFSKAVEAIEAHGIVPDILLLDGNPLHFDSREVNIVKGDAKCASIAAASIVAKVRRDALMRSYGHDYPCYGFADHKGYGSEAHRKAIEEHGLCSLHRRSFCTSFLQETLF